LQDFGQAALKQLEAAADHPKPSSPLIACQTATSYLSQTSTTPLDQPGQLPVIGVLKLTPEKGCSIVLALAQQLERQFQFLVVAGEVIAAAAHGAAANDALLMVPLMMLMLMLPLMMR
jgi:hypothetical protein